MNSNADDSSFFSGPALDANRDRTAWKLAFEGKGATTINDEVLKEVGAAVSRFAFPDSWQPEHEDIRLAAQLTAAFSEIQVYGQAMTYAAADRLLGALTAYPHRDATATRVLLPALRNFAREERESPEELWGAWHEEHERRSDLTLHTSSPRFEGQPHRYLLMDYEITTYSILMRDTLESWRVWAHIGHIPRTTSNCIDGVTNPTRRVGAMRLRSLVSFVSKQLEGLHKTSQYDAAALFVKFLIDQSMNGQVDTKDRQLLRDGLRDVQESLVKGLTRRSRLVLSPEDVELYNVYLGTIQKLKKKNNQDLHLRQCCEIAGIEPEALRSLIDPEAFHLLRPNKAAALVLSAKKGLGIGHPDTIQAEIANTRKWMRATDPKQRGKKRRGRPPKSG